MAIVQELIRGLVMFVDICFTILGWLLAARIILSWFGVNPHTMYNTAVAALFQVTDVLLAPFRKLPLQVGMMDFSPILAFLALHFVKRLIIVALLSLGGMVA